MTPVSLSLSLPLCPFCTHHPSCGSGTCVSRRSLNNEQRPRQQQHPLVSWKLALRRGRCPSCPSQPSPSHLPASPPPTPPHLSSPRFFLHFACFAEITNCHPELFFLPKLPAQICFVAIWKLYSGTAAATDRLRQGDSRLHSQFFFSKFRISAKQDKARGQSHIC